ncbi:uncharacterized protein LOC132695825 isoform X2 [Cylas formicarius]|nr:uncharacterized protein LOC132695825 isoform X2 [Cylas formicarius]
MISDDITNTAINDILIAHYGEDLFKKNRRQRSLYHVSNKLRECARFLLEIKKLGDYTYMLSTLKPESFDDIVEAVKAISQYDADTKTFGAASLALHFGTTIKNITALAMKLLLRKKIIIPTKSSIEQVLKNLERFKTLVELQWTIEVGSLATKNLNASTALKPKLLPLTQSVMILRKFVEEKGHEAVAKLELIKNRADYKILAETALIQTILHNRIYIGDIQYLDLNSYREQIENEVDLSTQNEMTIALSENEKLLTRHYKRITAIGKGSWPVTIMLPKKHCNSFIKLFTRSEQILLNGLILKIHIFLHFQIHQDG